MQRRIEVEQLVVGMYIHDLGVSWFGHDFVRSRFLVEDTAMLAKVRATGTKQLVIDTDKGLDVGQTLPSRVEVVEAAPAPAQTPEPAPVVRTSLEEELGVARKLHARARTAIRSIMENARAGNIATLDVVRDIADGMVESISRNAAALTSLAGLKTKDDYTFMHCVAVGTFMIALGRQIGLNEDELRAAGLAGLMHDVGKMVIPDEILNKPCKLTDAEFQVVRNHPRGGHDLLVASGFTHAATLDVVLHHHERVDGNGYPDRLKGDQLSDLARMGAVTDVYDAVTSERVYHKPMPPTAALRMMLGSANSHFDERMVRAFIKCVGIYPNGSLVKLASGRLAVVLEQNETQTLLPRVRVFYSTKSQLTLAPEDLDLSRGTDNIVGFEDPDKWGFDLSRYCEFVPQRKT